MHPAVRDDRIWFQSNPSAVVRFRRAVAGEFQLVTDHGGDAPIFHPSFCRSEAPTHWVAVVDLIRLVDTENWKPDEPTARFTAPARFTAGVTIHVSRFTASLTLDYLKCVSRNFEFCLFSIVSVFAPERTKPRTPLA